MGVAWRCIGGSCPAYILYTYRGFLLSIDGRYPISGRHDLMPRLSFNFVF